MMLNKIILIIFTLTSFNSFDQTGLIFTINPVLIKYGNLNKQNTVRSNDNFKINLKKIPSQNFQIDYVLNKSQSKNSFVFGLNYVIDHYKLAYQFNYPEHQNITVKDGILSFDKHSVGLRLGYKREINSIISIYGGFAFWLPFYPKESKLKHENGFTYAQHFDSLGNPTNEFDFVYNWNISSGGLYPQIFVPELRMEFRLYKNLFLNLGSQFKFFDLDKNSGYIDIRVQGTDKVSAWNDTNELFYYRFKRTELNYYLGLSYRINF